MSRIEPRVAALEALYASDLLEVPPVVEDLGGKARRLVEGVLRHLHELDAAIQSVSRGWRLDRMPAVDRNVLRIALFELRHTDTPPAVVISEAVTIAKGYSTARSGGFVNGVLGALAGAAETIDRG